MDALAWTSAGLGCIAVAEDVRRRRIPNWIPACALAAGLILHTARAGVAGTVDAAAGAAAGFLLFLVFFCRGGMGGGDVKLMAGFGALLGFPGALLAGLFAAVAGALIAVIALGWGRFRPRRPVLAIPYAPAIVLGVWTALIGRG